MNEKENDKLEHIMKKTYIPEPAAILKERITTEAIKAWHQSSQEIPWQIPFRRLVTSAAAAVLIISITNLYNGHELKQWNSEKIRSTQKQNPDPEILPEIPYRQFERNLVTVNRKQPVIDDSALRNYTERLRKILNEAQQNESSTGQVLEGGRSRLFKIQPDSDYYS
ncbi:MAG: hypothetical protein JW837_16335 [Sedimentisphaerales bacterium]|nr:hypothetical protein [Sedimentisphaerales bacterium]